MQIKPERPAAPDSEQWVRSWFAEHYQAGDVFAHCDAEALTLQAAVQFARAVAAAERERWAHALDGWRVLQALTPEQRKRIGYSDVSDVLDAVARLSRA